MRSRSCGWRGGFDRPRLIGHSVGEYVAACVSGALTLEDAIRLVVVRGQLMEQTPAGAMLAIPRDEATVQAWLGEPGLWLAAVNGPSQCAVAGTTEAVGRLRAQLADAGVDAQPLRTSGAFHSGLIDHVIGPLGAAARQVRVSAPRIPWVSNLTGTWITPEQLFDAAYWGQHLRQPVRFADGVRTLIQSGATTFLEAGPGNTLGSLVRRCTGSPPGISVVPSLRHGLEQAPDQERIAVAIARLWLAGVAIDWRAYRGTERRYRVELPPYPFERQRYWIDGQQPVTPAAAHVIVKNNDVASWFSTPTWTVEPPLQGERALPETWLVFEDQTGLARQMATRAAAQGHRVITVGEGQRFEAMEADAWRIDPASPRDYDALIDRLVAAGTMPRRIVHCWQVRPADVRAPEEFESIQRRGFDSIRALIQSWTRRGVTGALDLLVVGSHMERVDVAEVVEAARTTVQGLCLVIPQEHPSVRCGTVDLRVSSDDDAGIVADMLFVEASGSPAGRPVAFRNGQRWTRSYQPAPLPTSDRSVLRRHGTYLITGGLGRIGLEIAGCFARQAPVNLVLVGRTSPTGDDQRAALAAIEALGAKVMIGAADVADEMQLRDVVAAARQRFGGLHGVVHAAGIQRLTPIAALDRAACDEMFRAKVSGARMVQRVVEDLELDFVLLTSSLSALLGGIGMGAYAAANRFLDGLVDESASGRTRWITVDMDAWRFGPAIVATAVTELAMTPSEGLEAVTRVLDGAPPGRVVISTADLNARLERYVLRSSPRAAQNGRAAPAFHERPDLQTEYSAPLDEIEKTVADVWQTLLGIEQVGRHDNFFELGGHSLLLVQMHETLAARIGREVPITDLFRYPSVAQLAEHLAGGGVPGPAVMPARSSSATSGRDTAIAIVGMAGRFPGAPDIEAFWDNLRDGVEGITALTDEELRAGGVPDESLDRPGYVKVEAVSRRRTISMRRSSVSRRARRRSWIRSTALFLECAWEALETRRLRPGDLRRA